MRTFLTLGGVLGFLAVAIGAFGAHALKTTLKANDTEAMFQTGVQYHSAHALALLVVALLIGQLPDVKLLRTAGWLFVAGVAVFSGSLYALAVTNVRFLGAITPLGGLAFMAGWVCIAAAGRQSPSR